MSEKCGWVKQDGEPCRSYAVVGPLCRMHAKVAAKQHTPEPHSGGESVRDRLRHDAEGWYDSRLRSFFEEAMRATKTVYCACRKCGVKTPVEIEDYNARTNVVKLMLEQGYGRNDNAGSAGVDAEMVAETKRHHERLERAIELKRRDPVEFMLRVDANLLSTLEGKALAALAPDTSK